MTADRMKGMPPLAQAVRDALILKAASLPLSVTPCLTSEPPKKPGPSGNEAATELVEKLGAWTLPTRP